MIVDKSSFPAIRERRDSLKLTQEFLAAKAGVSRKTLVQIEKSMNDELGFPKRGISVLSLMRVARALGMTVTVSEARRSGRQKCGSGV